MLSSFQDRGREGYQHQGIPAAGAMDERAHRLANALAGNSGDPATLEMTLTGPTLRFDAPACFALAGADLGATLNGQEIPPHRPLVARAGDTLAFGARPANGVRAYLAVHGGFALAPVMGSETTYLRSGFGGSEFRISPQSDRMGYRLQGPALSMSQPRQMLSEAACFGTVQVPSGGEAIILMADRQTTGGYPKIAQIASVDLPLLAQYAPGRALRFAMIELDEAQRLDGERERAFAQLLDALAPLRALLGPGHP
nr:biotin-dependent carboxyltransferase family protein [Achromobacter xylosoxidans]